METNGSIIYKEPRGLGAIPSSATKIILFMAGITKKLLAQEFRRKGLSIGEIAKRLEMQKSGSISEWCKDIILSPKQKNILDERMAAGSFKGRTSFLKRLEEEKIKNAKILTNQGIKDIGNISRRDLFISGISLYWSEGYKYKGGEQVGFTNSDPRMILFIIKWFREICDIEDNKFSFQVKINKVHKNRIRSVENYWSKITGFPISQFNKSVLIKSKSKKIYQNHNNYYGTLRVTIRQSPYLRKRINGWIQGLTKDIKLPG